MKCDARTFAQMYEQVYLDLYRYALCLMKNPHEAEDVVSEAVIAAYEHIHRLRREDAFKSWIFTILTNACKRRLMKIANEQGKLGDNTSFPAEVLEVDYGLAVDVRNAFYILSEEEQMIVGLSVFGGYNSKEIGEILHLNPGTVRSKRSRALDKMACVL